MHTRVELPHLDCFRWGNRFKLHSVVVRGARLNRRPRVVALGFEVAGPELLPDVIAPLLMECGNLRHFMRKLALPLSRPLHISPGPADLVD